jgi:hypothetical protein
LTEPELSLTEQLVQHRRDRLRQEALADYPDAEPFGDLIHGDDEDTVRSVAKEVANRARALRNVPPIDPVEDAIRQKDFMAYLRATDPRNRAK